MEYSLLDVKYAYLAGLIDGEGCVSIINTTSVDRPGLHYQLRLMISMTHQPTIEFLAKEFGGRVNAVQQNKKWKTRYAWIVCSMNAKKLLTRTQPYLICKQEQARLGIMFQEQLEEHIEFYGSRYSLSKEETEIREKIVAKMHELNKRGTGVE
jgi:hypothetical protein